MPLTDTAVAFVVDHEIVVPPGAVALVGVALIDAVTDGGALMVTVYEIVPERTPFESTASAV